MTTSDDRSSDGDAVAAVLAGDFDTALAGVVGSAFPAKIQAARRDLQAARSRDPDPDRPELASTAARFPVAPWGWADYRIPANAPSAGDPSRARRPPVLVAVGVVAPGQHNISELAISHDLIPVKTQAAVAGAGGAVAGGVIGGMAGWPGWLDVIAVVGLGGAGITAQLAWYRSRIRNRRLSWRIRADDPAAPALTATLAVLMKLTTFLDRYDADMKHEASQQRVPAMPLDAHTLQVPAAIHQALWQLRTEITEDTGETVLAAARAAAAAAVTDVYDTWRAFDSFLPTPLAGDPEPVIVPSANPAKDLQDLADELHQEQQARRLAIDDVHQINTHHAPE